MELKKATINVHPDDWDEFVQNCHNNNTTANEQIRKMIARFNSFESRHPAEKSLENIGYTPMIDPQVAQTIHNARRGLFDD